MFNAFQTALETALEKLYLRATPVGTVATFMANAVPDGWLILNGQKVYQSAYPRLYAKLSTVAQLAKGTDGTGAYVTLPNADGRVLQGTSDLASVGKQMEASLPAISGNSLVAGFLTPDAPQPFASGYFTKMKRWVSSVSISNGTNGSVIAFDASDANSAYKGTSVQPAAVLTLVAIRY